MIALGALPFRQQAVSEQGLHEMDLDKMASLVIDKGPVDILDLEARFVRRTMRLADNNVSKAASRLGISRPTMGYRLVKHKIEDTSR